MCMRAGERWRDILTFKLKETAESRGREERESFKLHGLASGVFHARMTEESLLSESCKKERVIKCAALPLSRK